MIKEISKVYKNYEFNGIEGTLYVDWTFDDVEGAYWREDVFDDGAFNRVIREGYDYYATKKEVFTIEES